MLALADPLAPRKLLHPRHIDAVDARAIVRKQRRKRPADDLAAVDDGDGVPEEAVSVRQDRVVDAEVLEDFDDGEGRAGEDGFLRWGGRVGVQEADVLVEIEDVAVGEALDVFGEGDGVAQVVVLGGVEDRVVDYCAVDGRVGVAG